ncbi:MAG: hypothetical protein CL760_11685 [Chloroflexi bacterium]|nr:hypothetical protein [Chloroflexota bacterium]|tara:strand:+ start:87602 stop:87808 length:207 start_codon:yes stop_codon:yes gene_type:complete
MTERTIDMVEREFKSRRNELKKIDASFSKLPLWKQFAMFPTQFARYINKRSQVRVLMKEYKTLSQQTE